MLAKLTYYLNMSETRDDEEGIKYRQVITGAVSGVLLSILRLAKIYSKCFDIILIVEPILKSYFF